jgi:tetratricopeptide (TPR) repeat protein
VDDWRTVLDAASGIDIYGNNGLAVGDIFGDGLDGFYVCQPSGLPNRLYRNRGDGTFEDISEAAGVDLLDGTASALFADFRNSGHQDLLVVRTNGPLLFRNEENGKFRLQPDAFHFAKPPSGTFTGVAAADYDRNGFLDIYFCLYAYYRGLSQYDHPQPYYDAQNGPPNFLLRNRGDGSFEDVTERSGMNQNNNRFSFASGWCDFNGDGWPDLYVANDFGRKNLYRNHGDGTFSDIAAEAGVEDYGAGMSVSWFDYDNDGRPDLYVTDMWSAAGKRVTGQTYFLPSADAGVRQAYQKHAAGNSLFHNEGSGHSFKTAGETAHVGMGRWSWSADPWDFDHDGQQDLYVTNGFISGSEGPDLSSFFWRQIVGRSLDGGSGALDYQLAWNAVNELIRADYSWNGFERNVAFLNNGDGTFAEVSGLLKLDFLDDSRAFALLDLDGDGRLEVILKNRTGPQLRILRNEMEGIGSSVIFRLKGRKGNHDAIGSTVTVQRGSLVQTRYLQAGSGFLSQHTKDLHFGIGSGTEPLSGTVRWPDGSEQRFTNLPFDHRIVIIEGQSKYESIPFRAELRGKITRSSAVSQPNQMLPSRFATWLLEPVPALPFTLPDPTGHQHSLSDFADRPLLLTIVGGECDASREQVSALVRHAPAFSRRQIALAVIHPPPVSAGGPSRDAAPFPVLAGDEKTAGAYSILYRYLFDRRRELRPPVSFLIDNSGQIVRVYVGTFDPLSALEDWTRRPQSDDERLKKAIGLAGRYQGGMPHRNYFTYGVAFIQSNYPDAALVCFDEAAKRDPNYAATYYNLGTIYLNQQNLPEARKNLERAVALDPQDADAWTNLGAIAGQQKNYDEALEFLKQAVRANPAHLVALQNLVMLYRWQGHLDKAQAAIEDAIRVQPNDPEFHFALGMLLAGQEQFEGARKELERALELRNSDATTLNNLGVVYLRLGRIDDALNCFERCTKMSPDYDRPYLNIALVYKQQGRQSDARAVLQGFASQHPANEEIRKALGEMTP